MSENVGASTSHNPKGLHGLYRDSFTFTIYTHIYTHTHTHAHTLNAAEMGFVLRGEKEKPEMKE
jgi:hypothetical protein